MKTKIHFVLEKYPLSQIFSLISYFLIFSVSLILLFMFPTIFKETNATAKQDADFSILFLYNNTEFQGLNFLLVFNYLYAFFTVLMTYFFAYRNSNKFLAPSYKYIPYFIAYNLYALIVLIIAFVIKVDSPTMVFKKSFSFIGLLIINQIFEIHDFRLNNYTKKEQALYAFNKTLKYITFVGLYAMFFIFTQETTYQSLFVENKLQNWMLANIFKNELASVMQLAAIILFVIVTVLSSFWAFLVRPNSLSQSKIFLKNVITVLIVISLAIALWYLVSIFLVADPNFKFVEIDPRSTMPAYEVKFVDSYLVNQQINYYIFPAYIGTFFLLTLFVLVISNIKKVARENTRLILYSNVFAIALICAGAVGTNLYVEQKLTTTAVTIAMVVFVLAIVINWMFFTRKPNFSQLLYIAAVLFLVGFIAAYQILSLNLSSIDNFSLATIAFRIKVPEIAMILVTFISIVFMISKIAFWVFNTVNIYRYSKKYSQS